MSSALRAAAGAWFAIVTLAGAPAAAPEPRMIGEGVLSTPANEFGGTVTPDGNELYFSISVPQSYRYAIYLSRRTKSGWGRPELAPWSGEGRDFDPVLSPDGRRLLFISDRPTRTGEAKKDYDVWEVDRTGHGWSPPRNLGAPINGMLGGEPRREEFASLAADGTMYLALETETGMGIYRSDWKDGRYQEPVSLGDVVNVAGALTGEPIIAPDQSFLLLASYGRKGGFGGWDIFISRHEPDGSWTDPENLGPRVNTPQRDYSPRLMLDGHTLIFTSERYFGTGLTTAVDWPTLAKGARSVWNGYGNLYEIDLRDLGLHSLPPAPAATGTSPPAR